MFGKKKAEQAAKAEAALLDARKSEQRLTALLYLQEALDNCEAYVDWGVLLGAVELAERLELITKEECKKIKDDGTERHLAYLAAKNEANRAKAAERKAERAAAAKAAKEAMKK